MERLGEWESRRDVVFECPRQGEADVAGFPSQPLQGLGAIRITPEARGSDCEIPLCVACPGLVPVVAHRELLECVLAGCLQKEEPPALPRTQEALVDERLERIETGVTDLFCGLELEAPDEHGEAGEQPLLWLTEQVVAPSDRGPHRALALGDIPPHARKERKSLLKPSEELRLRKELDASSGELERERKTVQPLTDRTDLRPGLEPWLHFARASREQLDRVAPESGGTGYSCSPATASRSRLVTIAAHPARLRSPRRPRARRR